MGEARIARTLSDDGKRTDTPKSGHGRTVDLSQQLVDVLHRFEMERKAESLRRGWRDLPAWVFCSSDGGSLDPHNVRRAFRKVLKRAGLPGYFTPHSLRHTYASLLLIKGVSVYYVQRQLGHTSIQLTVDTYGKWLPVGNKAAVNLLDGEPSDKVAALAGSPAPGPSGSKVVATAESGPSRRPQAPELSSGPPRI